MSNGNNPYEDFFELTQPDYEYESPFEMPGGGESPYVSGDTDIISDINWEQPSAKEWSRIQQDPRLQAEYLQQVMGKGSYFTDDAPLGGGRKFGVYDVSNLSMKQAADALWGQFGGGDFDKESLKDLFGGEGFVQGFSGDQQDKLINYFLDMQSGMSKLGSGDIGISNLERELGLAERGVTGPGGLTSQRDSIIDILQKNIGRKRETYIDPEKTSRYSALGGQKTQDPTESYLAGAHKDIGIYETGVGGINKSIYDVLHGTGEGSVFDIYGDYADLVKGSLIDPSGDPWYGG